MEQQEQLALEQSKQKIVMKEMSTAARGSIMRVSQVIVRCVDFTPSVTSEYWQAEGRGLPAVRTWLLSFIYVWLEVEDCKNEGKETRQGNTDVIEMSVHCGFKMRDFLRFQLHFVN